MLLTRNVQIDTQDDFLLGFNVIGVTGGDEQNGVVVDLYIAVVAFDVGAALQTKRQGAVLPGCDDTVLRRKMQFDDRQKVKM